MTAKAQIWSEWLTQITQEDKNVLHDLLSKQVSSSKEVEVLRNPIETYLYDSCPPYIDVFRLVELYNYIAYKDNLIVKGPKGDGKSLSIQYFAHTTATPLIMVECKEGMDERHLEGNFFLRGMETPFVLGSLPAALDVANEYGRAILLFEELNALPPPVQKSLNALLDYRKIVSIPSIGRTYKLNEGNFLWIVATMNPTVYGGTYDLNDDLRSRFEEVEIGYPPSGKEVEIIRSNLVGEGFQDDHRLHGVSVSAVKLANETRQQDTQYSLATRDVVRLVRDILVLGEADALQLAACKFEGEDREAFIARTSSHFHLIKPLKKTWGGLQ